MQLPTDTDWTIYSPFLLLALAVRDDSRNAENCGGGNLDAGLQAGRLSNGPPKGPSIKAVGLNRLFGGHGGVQGLKLRGTVRLPEILVVE
jgi:hypothetical protein